jgi:hypothetical protein
MTAMEGGNAVGLPGATLAHLESLLKVTMEPPEAYQAATNLISTFSFNGSRIKSGMTSGIFIEFRN